MISKSDSITTIEDQEKLFTANNLKPNIDGTLDPLTYFSAFNHPIHHNSSILLLPSTTTTTTTTTFNPDFSFAISESESTLISPLNHHTLPPPSPDLLLKQTETILSSGISTLYDIVSSPATSLFTHTPNHHISSPNTKDSLPAEQKAITNNEPLQSLFQSSSQLESPNLVQDLPVRELEPEIITTDTTPVIRPSVFLEEQTITPIHDQTQSPKPTNLVSCPIYDNLHVPLEYIDLHATRPFISPHVPVPRVLPTDEPRQHSTLATPLRDIQISVIGTSVNDTIIQPLSPHASSLKSTNIAPADPTGFSVNPLVTEKHLARLKAAMESVDKPYLVEQYKPSIEQSLRRRDELLSNKFNEVKARIVSREKHLQFIPNHNPTLQVTSNQVPETRLASQLSSAEVEKMHLEQTPVQPRSSSLQPSLHEQPEQPVSSPIILNEGPVSSLSPLTRTKHPTNSSTAATVILNGLSQSENTEQVHTLPNPALALDLPQSHLLITPQTTNNKPFALQSTNFTPSPTSFSAPTSPSPIPTRIHHSLNTTTSSSSSLPLQTGVFDMPAANTTGVVFASPIRRTGGDVSDDQREELDMADMDNHSGENDSGTLGDHKPVGTHDVDKTSDTPQKVLIAEESQPNRKKSTKPGPRSKKQQNAEPVAKRAASKPVVTRNRAGMKRTNCDVHESVERPHDLDRNGRPKRTRIAPLEWWRGERKNIVASKLSNGLVVPQIASVTRKENVAVSFSQTPKRLTRKSKKRGQTAKEHTSPAETNAEVQHETCLDETVEEPENPLPSTNLEREPTPLEMSMVLDQEDRQMDIDQANDPVDHHEVEFTEQPNVPLTPNDSLVDVYDPATGDTTLLPIRWAPDQIEVQPVGGNVGYSLHSLLTVNSFHVGVIKLAPGEFKPNRGSKDHCLMFVIMRGDIEVTVHRSRFMQSEGNVFVVPPHNQYRIENVGQDDAILYFSLAVA